MSLGNNCDGTVMFGCGISPGTSVGTTPSSSELATITVSSKIPEFWTEMPRVWFAQFETVMAPQKQGDDAKYSLVVSKLDKDAIRQISDILISPPTTDKYNTLKNRLLSVYEESEERQFQKLVSEMELGDQKPSQLLRRMKELAKNTNVPDKTLLNLWTSRLPPHVRAVLTVSQDQQFDNLAGIADKIVENSRGDICEVSTSQPSVMIELLAQMNKLSLEVAALRAQVSDNNSNRSNYRDRSRSRSQSRSRITPDNPKWLCKYHLRYRNRARNCVKPCNWKKPSEN
ncbi:uncharacterized protein LOC114360067 [Ostrinia furnacalis]|uniref:uncharacterized protein LOC114360067 n=1 Tax=Ostrinia furnacalis TaxID=93504 RepID=UPI00104012E8|nr:uncharacterized protein LOC114360067 [Ostrinia furnacalis]